MGNIVTEEYKDFHWTKTENMHAKRRIEILKKHPEIKSLMKSTGDRKMVFYGIILMIMHFSLACFNSWIDNMPLRFLLCTTIGCLLSSAIFLQMHEAIHGLTFGTNHVWKNRFYGFFLNLGLVMPFYPFFGSNHKIHHKYQGEMNIDVEYPYEFELKYFNGSIGKYIWLLLNPLLQLLRPEPPNISLPKLCTSAMSIDEKMAATSCLIFNVWLALSGHFYVVCYFAYSTFIALTFNFLGSWNVTVHTEFFHEEETVCYYGWVNVIMSNFGYHVQHHDFPSIPSRYLPQVQKIAPEYYEECHTHDSMISPMIKFIFDNKYTVGSRVKRIMDRGFVTGFLRSPSG